VTIEKYIEEYRFMKKDNQEEEWLRYFFNEHIELITKYESISSNLPPDAAEIIGEIRERKQVISWLKEMKRSHEDPIFSAALEYAATSIENGEHF
jgi:hypothetical protein